MLNTNKGDYPNNPEYGADLVHFVHAAKTERVLNAIESTIRAEVGVELPYISIIKVEFDTTTQQGGIFITVRYQITAELSDEVSVSLS